MTDQKEQEKKAKLRKNVEYQVACEEKAFRIVERLIENPVEHNWFVDSLQFITPSHYQDVVEERAVSKLCGYPLCPKPLGNVPSQKYFISTKSNKVYDIEERKNFCNSRCYKASKYIEKQISTDPVWSRKERTRRVFDLLPLNEKLGKLGEEVLVSGRDEMKAEVKKLERLDHYRQSLEQMGQTHNTPGDGKQQSRSLTDNTPEADGKEDCVYTLDKALSEMGIGSDEEENKGDIETEKDKSETMDRKKNVKDVTSGIVKEKIEVGGKDSSPEGNKRHNQKQKVTPSSQQSKTEYLMRLLDKKKSLLAKMADIQSVSGANSMLLETTAVDKPSDDKIAEKNEEKDMESNKKTLETVDMEEDSDRINFKECYSRENLGRTEEAEVDLVDVKQSHNLIEDVSEHKVIEQRKETKSVSVTVLQVICESMRSWITKETADYLKKEREGSEPKIDMKQYDKQFRALVAKVDAQERDFSELIGEESLEQESGESPSAPAPHFDVLREEMEGNQLRVREFMKGSFTYKEKREKTCRVDKNEKEIILPTVDKYDQLLIRQRIVLDRINKILPDLMSPLQLTVGDIFSEIRQLTETFNFTRENILFKPTEWTVVTLILLKMLSRKQLKLSRAFSSDTAAKFLSVLLNGIKTNLETLEKEVDSLTNM